MSNEMVLVKYYDSKNSLQYVMTVRYSNGVPIFSLYYAADGVYKLLKCGGSPAALERDFNVKDVS